MHGCVLRSCWAEMRAVPDPPIPASWAEEAEQLAEALRRSLSFGEPASQVEEAEQLAGALRRSLVALEPDEEPNDPPSAPPPPRAVDALATGPPNEPPREGEGFRFYAVWEVPGRPDARGLWWGPQPQCWRSLAECLPGGRYGPGVHLRGYPSWQDAAAGYLRDAAGRGAPQPPPLHFAE